MELNGGNNMPKPFCQHGKLWTTCDICLKEHEEKEKFITFTRGKFRSDRNLAFKCNWMDTDFERPCTVIGRKFNIYKAKHVWCTQPQNECTRLEEGKIQEVSSFPCYESAIFHDWKFGAGVYHHGKRKGTGIKIDKVMIGKLALLTTRGPQDNEEDRSIFGFLRIKDYYEDGDGATNVAGDKETSLKIPKDSRLLFWDFYRNPNTPEKVWHTGLFRYVHDNSILEYLRSQLETLQKNNHEEESDKVEEVLGIFEENLSD